MSEKLLLNVQETAEVLNLCDKTVYQLARREDFPVIRLGSRILIPAKGLETWIEKMSRGKIFHEN